MSVNLDDSTPMRIVGIELRSDRGADMSEDDEPDIVTSRKSMRVIVDGLRFSIEIYRLETDSAWTLEVVDPENTSHVWDDQFASDTEARDTGLAALNSEGAVKFMRGDNVVPFRR